MVEKLISVIVPVYNVERFLGQCVESIRSQTYSKLEIILVDDGSTDNGSHMCDGFAEADYRIKVIHQTNAGLSAARNSGLDIASGEYILLVDSDDYIAPEMCEKMLGAIDRTGADLCVCNFLHIGELNDEQLCHNRQQPLRSEVLSGRKQIENTVLESQEYYWVVAWNKLYSRRLFASVRFQKGKLHEDEFIFHEIYTRCSRVVCVEEPLYYYLHRSGSITVSPLRVQNMDGVEAYFVRADALIRMKCSHRSIFQSLILGINGINSVFEYGVDNDPAFYQRFIQLRSQFRKLNLSVMLRNVDGIPRKTAIIIAYFCPRLFWHLRRLVKKIMTGKSEDRQIL